MFFSLLVPFRDRDINTLERCFSAVGRQDFPHVELLFIDSGSAPSIGEQARALCARFPFIRYHHAETRGLLWNKSLVLNYLIQASTGEYILILDADIEMSDVFLRLAYQKLEEMGFPPVLELRVWETSPTGKRVKLRTGRGIYLAKRTHLIAKGGYDTFFKVWGVEDEEIIRRIAEIGKPNPVFVSDEAPLLHLWHPIRLDLRPKGWAEYLTYQYMAERERRNFLPTPYFFDQKPPLAYEERPVLQRFDRRDRQGVRPFAFGYPFMLYHTRFIAEFEALKAGEFLCVEQNFELYTVEKRGFKHKIVDFCNKLLAKARLSYRLTDIATHDTEFLPLLTVRDFIFYFLVNFEARILDYYFHYDEKSITFWVMRKENR